MFSRSDQVQNLLLIETIALVAAKIAQHIIHKGILHKFPTNIRVFFGKKH
jgi:hypothetical protein